MNIFSVSLFHPCYRRVFLIFRNSGNRCPLGRSPTSRICIRGKLFACGVRELDIESSRASTKFAAEPRIAERRRDGRRGPAGRRRLSRVRRHRYPVTMPHMIPGSWSERRAMGVVRPDQGTLPALERRDGLLRDGPRGEGSCRGAGAEAARVIALPKAFAGGVG